MTDQTFLWAILAMTSVMLFLRIAPLLFFKNKIKNKFIQSFLAYIPCAVLISMTIPEVFFKGANTLPGAIGGLVVALILSYFEQNLIIVTVSSAVAVFVVEQVLKMIG